VGQHRKRKYDIRFQRGTEFKNSDRLNHCVYRIRIIRESTDSFSSTSIKLIVFHDRYRHVRGRGLLLRKYSRDFISHHTFDMSRYVRGSVIIRAAPFFVNQFHIITSRREGGRERERERECVPHRSVAKMKSRKNRVCSRCVSVALRISSSFSCTRLMLF